MPSPQFVEHQTSSVQQDLPGQYVRGPSLIMRAMKPKQCLKKAGVEENSPAQGEISWAQRARWITSPQQHKEGSLIGTLSPGGERQRKGRIKLQASYCPQQELAANGYRNPSFKPYFEWLV